MTFNTSTLRPGLLVSLKTSVTGNVDYKKVILDEEKTLDDGSALARWETSRTINDPAEHEEATKLRGQARSLVSGVCVQSTFGLLCPEEKAAELAQRVEQARALAEEFNARAKITTIKLYIVAGRVSPDDVEAVRAIKSEMRELMEQMEDGLKKLDVNVVRDAASKAKSVGRMLSPQMQERVEAAVKIARDAAREIVKAGEAGAAVIDKAAIARISEQRTLFLDLDNAKDVAAPVATVDGRAVDFAPDPNAIPAAVSVDAPQHQAPQVEIEQPVGQPVDQVEEAPNAV